MKTSDTSLHESFRRDEPARGSSDRVFGLVFTGFFTIVGLWPLWRDHPVRWWAFSVAAGCLAVSVVRPAALAPLNRAWTWFGRQINKITNPIVLGVLFYLVFTPLGFVIRVFRRDPLGLRFDAHTSTYWLPRRPPGPPPDSMARQF